MQKIITSLTNLFSLWIVLCSGIALFEPSIFTWFTGAFITYGLGLIMRGMGGPKILNWSSDPQNG